MNYEETIDFLYSQLPVYQRIGKAAYKANLDSTHQIADLLNHPENKFKSIHVAGTNGKGSVSHMLASILQEAGYKTGLYTSPHLKDFRERVKINGEMIAKEFVMDFVKNNQTIFSDIHPSFFEWTVGLAFEYFSKEKVDVAVLETGMGGRLDSTNIVMPEVSVITNIGLDHTQYLGTTLKLIAGEKAGIIKKAVPVVIGESHVETREVFMDKARKENAAINFAEDVYKTASRETDLMGNYQLKNVRTVLMTLEVLRKKGWKISEAAEINGFRKVVSNTGLLGRWQILSQQPLTITDTAHNYEGLSYVLEQIQSQKHDRLHIVFGAVNDKDMSEVLKMLPREAQYYFCKPSIPRGLDAEELRLKAEQFRLKGKSYESVDSAYKAARNNATNDDLIFIGGSTFVVAEVI